MMYENAGDFWCIVEDIGVPDMEARRGPKENCTASLGQIAVQAEGSEVEFRKLEVVAIEKTTPVQ